MADNYLEKKYEALQKGKAVYRRSSPSLDSLLRTAAADPGPGDGSYVVKSAQLQAIVRSATLLNLDYMCNYSEMPDGTGEIVIHGSDVKASGDDVSLGAFLLAMRLKASELGLRCHVFLPGSETGNTPSLARVEVFK